MSISVFQLQLGMQALYTSLVVDKRRKRMAKISLGSLSRLSQDGSFQARNMIFANRNNTRERMA